MKEEVKKVREMENSVQEMSGEGKQFNDKIEILKSKAGVIDSEVKKKN